MAAVPLPNATKKSSSPTDAVESPTSTLPSQRVEQRGKRERRGLSRWLVLLVLLGIGVYFLPDLVARTALRQSIPRFLAPHWSGSVELGETSLGWFAPIDIRDITVLDREGNTLATVSRLQSTATLWGLITHPHDLGEFRFEQSVVHLQSQDKKTNWDAPLAELSRSQSSSSSNRGHWNLQFLQTQVLVTNVDDGLEHTLSGFDVTISQGNTNPEVLTVLAQFPPDAGQQNPSFTLTATIAPNLPPSIQLATLDFDLARLEPLCHFVSPLGIVRGRMTGTLKADVIATDGTAWSVDSNLEIKDGTAAGWELLAGDILQLEQTSLRGRLLRSSDRLEFEHLKLQTDFAKLSAHGNCQWSTASTIPATADEAWQAFGDDFQVTAVLDAAKTAQRLPKSLRLKSDVAITSGQIQATVQCVKDEKGRALDGTARLTDLAAHIDGQERRWTAPLDAQLLLRPSADGIQCDRLALRSDYCQILGQGTPNAARFRITADLDRLWQEIAPLVDWKDGSLAGTARLDGTIQRQGTDAVALHIDGNGEGLRCGSVDHPVWSEPKITIALDIVGQGPNSAPWSTLSSGTLQLQSGDDRCEAKLTSAINWTSNTAPVPVTVEVAGDWTRWQQRLRPFWLDPTITFAGKGTVLATLTYSPATIDVQSAIVKSQPLTITTADWQMHDTAFESTLQGVWDVKSRTWTTPRTKAQGEWGEVTWTDGRFAADQPAGNLSGQVDLNINVGRVSRWQHGDVKHHLLGQLSGSLDLKPDQDALAGDIHLRMANVVVAGLSADPQPRWIALWREPELTVKGHVQHRLSGTPWDIAALQLSASGLSLATTGRIDPRVDATEVNLNGQIAYDWEQLMSRLDSSWAEKIRLSGRGERPFSVRGTMRPAADGSISIADLSGEGQLTWEQATLYGMPLTANDLSARFAQGHGQLGPLDLMVAEGRVHLAPQLDFRQQALLTLPAGRVVDQVKLTPQVCQQLLKYALPLAADAAEMDGEFSLDVADNVWPLASPQAGQARGTMTIHHARIEPGPLAGRLTTVVEQVRAVLERRNPAATSPTRVVLEFPQQQVALTQTQGRVYHDRMTVRINDLDLVTGGSVGFDETLQLTFLLPIQEKWVRGTPALAKLAGQTLRIPVNGTLSQPQVDPSVLGDLARQAAGSTIEKAIDDTVLKQLDRLLPRRN